MQSCLRQPGVSWATGVDFVGMEREEGGTAVCDDVRKWKRMPGMPGVGSGGETAVAGWRGLSRVRVPKVGCLESA
ncbi:MAG: hypothetical protein WBO48_00250 [Candidatus Promineifilaceae bacterium]